MEFQDISAQFKAKREAQAQAAEVEYAVNPAEEYQLRARIVGVLLRDARVSIGRSLEDCARLLNVTPEQIETWETGDETPSLSQLELLAFYLDVPVSHFWGTQTKEADYRDYSTVQAEFVALRDRMIGAMIHQARDEKGLTLEAIANETALSVEQLSLYESGQEPIPMHYLQMIAHSVGKNLSHFLENSSQIGTMLSMREEWKHFIEMPEELRKFAANPLNAGFIEIAMMLAQMPVDRLRRVGESVLNITM